MSFHKEDGVSSLCQKALHIVTELCFAGQVEWEKCSGIFPPDRGSQGGGSTGNPRRAPLASSRPARTLHAPFPALVSGASRAALGASLGRRSFLPRSFSHSSAGDFERWLSRFSLISTHPAPSTSLVCSLPAGGVWLPGSRAPSPRSPTPRVSLPEWNGERGRRRRYRSPSATRGVRSPTGLGLPRPIPGVTDRAGLGKGPGGTVCAWTLRTVWQMGLRWPPKAAKIPEGVTRGCDLLST